MVGETGHGREQRRMVYFSGDDQVWSEETGTNIVGRQDGGVNNGGQVGETEDKLVRGE